MRKWLIKKLGGYTDIKDVILYIKNAGEEEKHELLTMAVERFFNAVSVDDILKENRNKEGVIQSIQFEGKTLDASYWKNLQEQAHILTNMMLWKVLKKDVEYQLRKKMFEEAVLNGDMVWGKLITFLWDVINTRIARLQK